MNVRKGEEEEDWTGDTENEGFFFTIFFVITIP